MKLNFGQQGAYMLSHYKGLDSEKLIWARRSFSKLDLVKCPDTLLIIYVYKTWTRLVNWTDCSELCISIRGGGGVPFHWNLLYRACQAEITKGFGQFILEVLPSPKGCFKWPTIRV